MVTSSCSLVTKCAYEAASAVQRAFAPADAKVSEGGKLDGMLIGPDVFVKARLSEDVDKMVGVIGNLGYSL